MAVISGVDFDKLIKKSPAMHMHTSHEHLHWQVQLAQYDANKAIELDPNLAEAYENRGTIKVMMEIKAAHFSTSTKRRTQ